MRTRLVCLFVALLTALTVFVSVAPAAGEEAAGDPATVAINDVRVGSLVIGDEAKMVIVGAALISLATALRRAA